MTGRPIRSSESSLEVRTDPLSGRQIVVAPRRGDRPGGWLPAIEPATDEELESCPFCAGREDRTPPDTLRLGDPWRVRVVPNLYPAFKRQEVVIHTPEHVRSFADLGDDQLPLIAEAWAERARAMSAEDAGQAHAFVNEGRLAGASIAHSHSQLVALPGLSPAEETERQDRLPGLLEHDDLVVAELSGVVALVHPFGAGPYECLIVPREPEPEALAGGESLVASLRLLQRVVRALRVAEGPRPWNAWFHSGTSAHAHFVPRLTALAGLELGAGLYVNPLPPDHAAATLRAA